MIMPLDSINRNKMAAECDVTLTSDKGRSRSPRQQSPSRGGEGEGGGRVAVLTRPQGAPVTAPVAAITPGAAGVVVGVGGPSVGEGLGAPVQQVRHLSVHRWWDAQLLGRLEVLSRHCGRVRYW